MYYIQVYFLIKDEIVKGLVTVKYVQGTECRPIFLALTKF